MKELDIDEKVIAKIIARSRRKLTTSQISKFSEFSWIKTKRILESLREKTGLISKQTLGNRIYWFVKRKTSE